MHDSGHLSSRLLKHFSGSLGALQSNHKLFKRLGPLHFAEQPERGACRRNAPT
jgi:hypothetical protein